MTESVDSLSRSDAEIVSKRIPSVGWRTELMDSLSRSDAEIVSKRIPSVGRRTELMDSLSSSNDRIGGFPQQVGCHLVLIWSFFDPLT